jgi:hypothetical protein
MDQQMVIRLAERHRKGHSLEIMSVRMRSHVTWAFDLIHPENYSTRVVNGSRWQLQRHKTRFTENFHYTILIQNLHYDLYVDEFDENSTTNLRTTNQ